MNLSRVRKITIQFKLFKLGTDQRTKRLEVLLLDGPVFDELLNVALGAAGADAVYFLPYKVLEFLIDGLAPLPHSRGVGWHHRIVSSVGRRIVSSVGWILVAARGSLWLLVTQSATDECD